MTLRWRPLSADDIPAIVALAGRVLAVDGGLPLVADEPFLRRRFPVADAASAGPADGEAPSAAGGGTAGSAAGGDAASATGGMSGSAAGGDAASATGGMSGSAVGAAAGAGTAGFAAGDGEASSAAGGGRSGSAAGGDAVSAVGGVTGASAGGGIVGVEADGRIVAAAALRPPGLAAGLVDPAVRGRGHGAHLVDWALATSPSATLETEALTEAAAALFASRGLVLSWAEDVMRYDLSAPPPEVPLPAGVTVEPWSDDATSRFFAVYEAAFRDRPGFPGWSAAQWVEWTTDDDEFRPDWSLLAVDPASGDVGFVTAGEGWIVQVGVRPDARGRAIGAGLVVESMRRMRAAGASEVLLDVNVDNPAGELYRRLGFTTLGRRARFTRP